MAATVDQLLVQIDASSDRLRRELRKAERDITGFERGADRSVGKVESSFSRMGSSLAGMSRYLGPLAGFMTGGAILTFAQQTVSATAELGDMAERLGVNVERLQELRYAAEQSGSSAAQLDQGLRALTGRLADADRGTGDAAAQFRRLGIETRDASGNLKGADVVLVELAERLRGAKTQAERAAIAAKVLGEDAGPGLASLLARGEQGLADLATAARKNGGIIRSELVATAQEVDAEWKALINTLTVNMQSAILYVVKLAKTATQLTPLAQQVSRIREDIAATEEQLATRGAVESGRLTEVPGLPSREFLERRLAALRRLQAQLEAPATPDVVVPDPPPMLPPPAGAGGRGRAADTRADAQKAAEREAQAIASVTAALGFELDQMTRTDREREIASALRQAGIDETHAEAAALKELAGKVYDTAAAGRALDDALNRDEGGIFGTATEAIDTTTAAADGLEGALLGGLLHAVQANASGFKSWEDAAVSAISHVLTEVVRLQAAMQAQGKRGPLSGLFDALGSAVGGLFGGGGGGVFGFGGGMLPDAAAAGVPGGGFAMGGRPPVGMASLVGERGPEVFVPDVPGTVVPNFAIKPQGNAGGGGTVNYYTVDARGANDPGAVQMAVARGIAAATPGIVRQSTAATRNRFTRERLIPVR